MTTPGITHQYGPWSPMRFIPVQMQPDDRPPAFWITTARVCLGRHDPLCRHAQNQTFGPLVLPGGTVEDVWICPSCDRAQPPVEGASLDQENCLFCTQGSTTVQQLGNGQPDKAAAASVAALDAASMMLRQVRHPQALAALMAGTQDAVRALLDNTSWAITQDASRSLHAGNGSLVLIARQILANAKGK